jgi:hypothetical protein
MASVLALVHLRILCVEVHCSSDEEGVMTAGNGIVEAAVLVQVGAKDLQGAKCLQLLEVGVLLRVIWPGFRITTPPSTVSFRAHELKTREDRIGPGFLTVVLTAYPFSSSILMSAEAMYPFPPVTHAVFDTAADQQKQSST